MNVRVTPWMPEQDRIRLAMLGKLLEELGEATQRAARCITHGLYETDPDTGQLNIEELRKELTDVEACMSVARQYDGDLRTLIDRYKQKTDGFEHWHAMIRKGERDALLEHASTSPGPVNCSTRKRHQGEIYPRTCERCGLGPCPFFNDDGTKKP